MIVSFNTQCLRDCCESLVCAEEVIGTPHAQELMTLLSDAEAAETALELIELYTPNVEVASGTISLPVGTGYRASFVAIGITLGDRSAEFDWGAVRRLKMMDLSPC